MNDRKQQVLITAQQLFIENGFLTTTIQDILDKAQISKGTFYNYFASKNECLMEILRHRDEEIFVKRQELLIGQDVTDKNILAKQILIRFQVNREQNLLPIFQAIFHSEDLELRNFINKYHLKEIHWLASRFIDIYGNSAKTVSFDGAILLLGMIQQLFHFLKASSIQHIDTPKIIHFTMRRMDVIITDMSNTNDILFQSEMSFHPDKNDDVHIYTKEQLHAELSQFLQETEDVMTADCKEHIQFIMEEIIVENPRTFILQSVLRSFRECFIDTLHARNAQEITARIWEYMETLE